jgi:hypothetical protein
MVNGAPDGTPVKNPDRSRRSGLVLRAKALSAVPARRINQQSIAVAAVPTPAASAISSSTTTSASTILAWTRLIDGQRASLEFLAVEGVDRGLGSVRHLHETETARLAGFAIHNDLSRSDGSVRAEKLAEIIGRCFE